MSGEYISEFFQMRKTTSIDFSKVAFTIIIFSYYFPLNYALCALCSYTGYDTDASHWGFYFMFWKSIDFILARTWIMSQGGEMSLGEGEVKDRK